MKERSKIMLSVTTTAKEKLKEGLQNAREDEETFLRIAPSPSKPNMLGFILDKEKEGDLVIEDTEGEGVLLIGQDVASLLNKSELDYGDTNEGVGFIITHS
jgi:Fe-S cluster assembly iron-binding protein IscA